MANLQVSVHMRTEERAVCVEVQQFGFVLFFSVVVVVCSFSTLKTRADCNLLSIQFLLKDMFSLKFKVQII